MKKKLLIGIAALIAVLMFIGCEEDPPEEDPDNELRVTGDMQGANIMVAAILDNLDLTEQQVPELIALGINNGNNEFPLYKDINFAERWKGGSGEYYITLVDVNIDIIGMIMQSQGQQPPDFSAAMTIYLYGNTWPVKYSIKKGTTSVSFDGFFEVTTVSMSDIM